MFPSDFQLSLPLLTPYSVENVASEELDAGDLKVSILEPSAAIISIRHLPAYPVYFSPPVQGEICMQQRGDTASAATSCASVCFGRHVPCEPFARTGCHQV